VRVWGRCPQRGSGRSPDLPLTTHGTLDICTTEFLAGWVRLRDDPAAKLVLEAIIEGHRVATGRADRPRPDLAAAGLGDGAHGFRILLPEGITESALQTLILRVGDTPAAFTYDQRTLIPPPPPPSYGPLPAVPRPTGPKRFSTCILHIGTEKTGTTTLQSLLGANRPLFAANGVYLPLILAPHMVHGLNHSHLATYAMDNANFKDHLRTDAGVTSKDSLAAFRTRIAADLATDLAAAPPDCRTLLLSAEHCHSRLHTKAEITLLRNLLEPHCKDFRILVYLRPQPDLARSAHGMLLVLGAGNIDIFPPMPRPKNYGARHVIPRIYFDYAALLRRWAEVFGADAIAPRLYGRASFEAADLITDFAAQTAPKLDPATLTRPPTQNTNVSALAQRFLIRFYTEHRAADVPPATRARIANTLRHHLPGAPLRPSREAAAEFLARFDQGNDWVRHHWFDHLPTLFPFDPTQYPEDADPTDITDKDYEHCLALVRES
jgi:hypothetical protein